MQIIEVLADANGIADLDGSRQTVDLSLIQDPCVGDYVIVHAGFAIEKLDVAEANARLELFAELAGTKGAG